MEKKNILHLLQRFRVGGKEEVVKNLMLAPSQTYIPHACVLQKIGFMAEQVISSGLKVHFIDMSNRSKRFQNLISLYTLIKKHHFKAIFCHDISSWYYGVMLSFFFKNIKIIHVRHSFLEKEDRKVIFLTRLLAYFSFKIVVVSSAIKDDIILKEKASLDKTTVIYNGIDIARYNNLHMKLHNRDKFKIPHNMFVTGTISRFFKVKNIESQIEMVEKLSKKIPNYLHIIVAPMSDYGEAIKQDVFKRKLEKHIIFLGFIKNIPEVLSVFDVFILTSFSEGTPIVLLEAMASRCPIVASSVGGNIKLISHMENGLLYNVDNVDELCASVLLLNKNDKIKQKLTASAYKKVCFEFDFEKMTKAYERLV